jgi:2-polyprenyl-3-methyl-5-hydroxy-6-metoxy-1,4-benzoquinol methylase
MGAGVPWISTKAMSEMSEPVLVNASVRQRRLHFPPPAPALQGFQHAAYLLVGLAAFPFYWVAGAVRGVPGLRFRWKCFEAGVRLLFVRGHLADAYRCIVAPMDSVRHFEMDFFWQRARALQPARVLDVSSPRLFTLLLLRSDRRVQADLLNPDEEDLARTSSLARALQVDVRCHFLGIRIDALPADALKYSLVVCMSVLEHIVEDIEALRIMWDRVEPGGRLLLSVPCSRSAIDEFTNVDEYGLLEHDHEGFVFWQRYYDEARLQALFAVTGEPVSRTIYAERDPGAYDADVLAKRTNPRYPIWREPYSTAKIYAYRANVTDLPGMGVVAMEFAKPTAIEES